MLTSVPVHRVNNNASIPHAFTDVLASLDTDTDMDIMARALVSKCTKRWRRLHTNLRFEENFAKVWQWQSKVVYKCMCRTTYEPDTKFNPNTNPNPNPCTKHHATLNIQLNIVACPTYQEKFVPRQCCFTIVRTSIVIVTLPNFAAVRNLVGYTFIKNVCSKTLRLLSNFVLRWCFAVK